MRWLAIVVLVIGCKKQEEPAPDPMPTAPSTGHSITKVNEPGEEGSGSPSGKSLQSAAKQGSATPPSGAPADAPLFGGNGKPAYRDDNGHLHGPGGPIFMGKGPDCTDKIDHCLRDGVWFAVGNVRPGALFRATPVFQFESKWWTFREQEADYQFLFRTKVLEKSSELVPGEPVIWLIHENSGQKWLDNEMDALTSSRWECGVVEAVGSDDTFRVKGWDWAVPTDTARIIVEKKSS